MVLDTSLLNTQLYKVRIKGKVGRPPLHLGVVAIEKGAFWSPLTTVANQPIYIYKENLALDNFQIYKFKVSDHSRGWPEGSLFDSYYTKV